MVQVDFNSTPLNQMKMGGFTKQQPLKFANKLSTQQKDYKIS